MRLALFAAVVALGACASEPPVPQPAPAPVDQAMLNAGAFAYGYRCKGCHEPPAPGAPGRAQLARMKPERILAALATGKMKRMALDMPADQMRAVAAYLTR